MIRQAASTAQDPTKDLPQRVDAVRVLALGDWKDVGAVLAGQIEPQQSQDVQLATLSVLAQFDIPDVAPIILDRYARLSPALRGEAWEVLFSRTSWTSALLNAMEQGSISPGELLPAQRQHLLAHPDSAIRDRASRVLAQDPATSRNNVVASYRDALGIQGDAAHGRQVFRTVCATCHRLENHGNEIGKDLAAVRDQSPEAILIHVLEPNREVDPKYVNYLIHTADGRIVSGMIDSETATSLTLRRAENATDAILRKDIDELRSTGMSIMPEGLEKQIDLQSMADLIAYLRAEK
jgi:putative heme-binding domain-containing protein